MAWRNCRASTALLAEVDTRWPGRSKASDGTIGDTAHQKAGTSDHLPNAAGVVRARDITAHGIDAAWLAEFLRKRGAAGDRRLTGGGYVIFNRRITRPDFSGWKVYTGANPHTAHVHVSFTRAAAGYDSTASWGIAGAAAATPTSRPVVQRGDSGPAVELIQRFLGVVRPGEPGYGSFGPLTEAAVRRYQDMRGLEIDGRVGALTWRETGL